MAKLIIASFPDRKDANEAVIELEEGGASQADFSIIGQASTVKTDGSEGMATEVTAEVTGEGMTAGGTVGGLAGLIAGAIATAGMFVAGPIVLLAGLSWVALTTVAGGAVGATAGGLVGALAGLGISREVAERHESIIKAGGVLLGVEDKEVAEAEIRKCFEDHRAEQIAVVEHATIPAKLAAAA